MNKCSVCGNPCHYGYLVCDDHGGPKVSDWRDYFSNDNKQVIEFVRDYASSYFNLAIPDSNLYILLSSVSILLDAHWNKK